MPCVVRQRMLGRLRACTARRSTCGKTARLWRRTRETPTIAFTPLCNTTGNDLTVDLGQVSVRRINDLPSLAARVRLFCALAWRSN